MSGYAQQILKSARDIWELLGATDRLRQKCRTPPLPPFGPYRPSAKPDGIPSEPPETGPNMASGAMAAAGGKAALDLLGRALDLCVRARRLDDAAELVEQTEKPGQTRSATMHLWVLDQYEKDLAEWETEARAFLTAEGYRLS